MRWLRATFNQRYVFNVVCVAKHVNRLDVAGFETVFIQAVGWAIAHPTTTTMLVSGTSIKKCKHEFSLAMTGFRGGREILVINYRQ